MKVYHRSHFGLVRAGLAEVVVDREKMLVGKLVDPLNHNFLSAANIECGTWESRTETPHARGFEVAVDVHLERPHGLPEVRNFHRWICRAGLVSVGFGNRGN